MVSSLEVGAEGTGLKNACWTPNFGFIVSFIVSLVELSVLIPKNKKTISI